MVVDAGNADLGRKVKEAAKEAGLSLIELGELMGVSRPTIYAYASGALKISSTRIEQIATLTGKPVTHFCQRRQSIFQRDLRQQIPFV